MTRRRGWLALLASVAAVAAVLWVLRRAGGGQLAPPPLSEPAQWEQWVVERDPVVAALAVVRLLALVLVWYLLVATVIGGVLRLFRAARLVSVADRLTIPALRRLLVATAGVTLAAGVNPALALAQSSGAVPPTTTTTTTSTTAATTTTSTTVGSRPPPTLTMRVLGPEGPSATMTPTNTPAAQPPPVAPGAAPGAAASAATTWTVRPGQCFWSIADNVLAQAWGRAPTDAEIVPYWRTLIEANRHALVDRANANLIYPGQVFTVPPAPPR